MRVLLVCGADEELARQVRAATPRGLRLVEARDRSEALRALAAQPVAALVIVADALGPDAPYLASIAGNLSTPLRVLLLASDWTGGGLLPDRPGVVAMCSPFDEADLAAGLEACLDRGPCPAARPLACGS